MDLITRFFDALKLPARHVFPVWLVVTILLFTPSEFVERIGLHTFKTSFLTWLGAIFLLTSALLLTSFGVFSYGKVTKWRKRQKLLKAGYQRLRSLTPDEQQVLGYYIHRKTRSQNLPPMSGVVGTLESSGIIYKASNAGFMLGPGWAYGIQPWAWDYLNLYPECVSLYDPSLDDDDEYPRGANPGY